METKRRPPHAIGKLLVSLLAASLLAGCAVYGPPPGPDGAPEYVDQSDYYYAPIYTEPFWLFDADFGHGRREAPHDRDHREPAGHDHGASHPGGEHSGHDGGHERGGSRDGDRDGARGDRR